MKFFEIIKGCFKPKTFLTKLPDENIDQPLKYLGIWTAILTIIGIPFAVIAYLLLQNIPGSQPFDPIWILIGYIPLAIAYYLIIIVFSFIACGIAHLILKLTGAKKGFAKTYQICIYSLTPSYLYAIVSIPIVIVSMIPFVGFFISILTFPISIGVSIYSMFLRIYGFAKAHKISYLKAAIPDIVAIVLMGVVFVGYIVFIIALISQSTI